MADIAEKLRNVLGPKMEKLYDDAYQDGSEFLAAQILCVLEIYPNNVERIERIKEVCTEIINNKKQEEKV